MKGKFDILYWIVPDSSLDRHITKFGILRDWISTRLGQFINGDSIIFDVGANVGLLSLPFAKKHAPEGHVYSFEPDPENFSQLQKNITLNKLKNIIPLQLAIQDDPTVEEIILHIRRAIDGDKLTNRGLSTIETMPDHNISNISVEASTIDKFAERNNISRIDFVKIDVEGSEYKVFNGGVNSFQNNLPIVLYEYSTTIDKLTNSNNSYKSFNFLKDLGYTQFQIFKEKTLLQIKEYDPILDNINVIAFHKSKIPQAINSYL